MLCRFFTPISYNSNNLQIIALFMPKSSCIFCANNVMYLKTERKICMKRSILKPTIKRLTANYVNTYMVHAKVKGVAQTKSNIKTINRYFGDLQFHQIKPVHIIQYINDRKKDGIKDNTIRRELLIFHSVVKVALDHEIIETYNDDGDDTKDKMIAERLLKTISRFKPTQTVRNVTPTHEQVNNILSKMNDYLRDFCMGAILTSYRRSELLDLDWLIIDFERKEISLYKDVTNKPGRNTPMYRELYVFLHNLWIRRNRPKSGPVFINRLGRAMNRENINRPWNTAVKKAGYLDDDGNHLFHFHDLRRYAIRRLQERYGFTPEMIRLVFSGHKSNYIFQKVYNGATPDTYNHFRDVALNS